MNNMIIPLTLVEQAVLSVLVRNFVFEMRDGPETKVEDIVTILSEAQGGRGERLRITYENPSIRIIVTYPLFIQVLSFGWYISVNKIYAQTSKTQ